MSYCVSREIQTLGIVRQREKEKETLQQCRKQMPSLPRSVKMFQTRLHVKRSFAELQQSK